MTNPTKIISRYLIGFFITTSFAQQTLIIENASTCQTIAVPSYFYPCSSGNKCYWSLLNAAVPKVGLAIINPDSGPGSSADKNYVKQVKKTKKAGALVLGYVYTNYANRSLSDVEADINAYYQWYGIDGIFIDQAYYADCSQASYYETLNSYIKSKGGRVTVINPGTNTQECYVNVADMLVIFEGTYKSYKKWVPSSWVKNYSSNKFWHIIYSTSASQLQSALQLSKKRKAGWFYVTNAGGSNPYDTLPTGAYWAKETNWAKSSRKREN